MLEPRCALADRHVASGLWKRAINICESWFTLYVNFHTSKSAIDSLSGCEVEDCEASDGTLACRVGVTPRLRDVLRIAVS